MSIRYPLQMPQTNPGPKSIVLSSNFLVGQSESPFTSQQQVYEWQGSWWELTCILPIMTRAQAEPWIAFLTALNGRLGTFLAGDPTVTGPLGNAGGVPIVCGIIPLGKVFYIVGLTGTLQAGDYFQVFDGRQTRLFKNLTAATAPAVNTTIAANISAGNQVVTPASMANILAGAALASDAFNRANLGASWTNSGSPLHIAWAIQGSTKLACTGNDALGGGTLTLNTLAWPADHFSQATLVDAPDADDVSVAVRCSTTQDTCYSEDHSAGQWRILKFVNGGAPVVVAATNGAAAAPGDVIRMEAQGTTITVKKNGVVMATGTDAGIAGGAPGFHARSSNPSGSTWNNWSGGDLSSLGTALAIDTGTALELVQVSAITGTTFTANFANAHTGPGIAVVGANVLDVFPRVRSSPANGAPISFALPQSTFRLKDNSIQWAIDEAKLYTITFSAKEASS